MSNPLSSSQDRRWDLFVLIVLTLLALLTRLYGISGWPITGDETATMLYSGERNASFKNPAYYNLVLISFKLFGASEWSLRLPAALIGALSIPIFYMTWRNVFGRNVALFGSLFAIFSAWHLFYSQFGRFYSGVFLFGSLSYYWYYQALRFDKPSYLIAALSANLAGFLFHVTAVMVSASCGVFSLIVLLLKSGSEYSRRIAAIHLGICLTFGLIALPFLWDIWIHRTVIESQSWGHDSIGILLQVTRSADLTIAISAFIGAMLLLKEDIFRALFLIAGIGIPILALQVAAAFVNVHAPYVIYCLPLMLLGAAVLCERVRQGLVNYSAASLALVAIIIINLLPPFLSTYSGKNSLDVRDAVTFVKNHYKPGDRIVSAVFEFNYYLGENYPIEVFANDTVRDDARIAALESYQNAKERVWVVVKIWRTPLDKEFETWLLQNASLVWQDSERRFDYPVHGYQVFLVDAARSDWNLQGSGKRPWPEGPSRQELQ